MIRSGCFHNDKGGLGCHFYMQQMKISGQKWQDKVYSSCISSLILPKVSMNYKELLQVSRYFKV